MERSVKQIVDRLGPAGLTRALDDLCEHTQLVRLANACGLKYPGMRAKSQSRERLVADLVDGTIKRVQTRKAVIRVLHKETASSARAWEALDIGERTTRLADREFLERDGNLGRHLFLVATRPAADGEDENADTLVRSFLLGLVSNGSAPAAPADKAGRELARLKRQLGTRDKKIDHLDAQLAKARESQKTAKRDLIRRKGELAESRMLVERLRGELAAAESAARAAAAPAFDVRSEKAFADLAKTVRQLTAEQRKLKHGLEAGAKNKGKDPDPLERLGSLESSLSTLGRDVATRFDAAERQLGQLDDLKADVRALVRRQAPTRSRRRHAKKDSLRVGVFIDVQNVYYAARRLKGKLDFDALMVAALRDRRLIKAEAYVVESKETDQSQFIKMLEHRGIEVLRKTLQVRADGSMKGDWDMELALNILDAAPGLDVVVLVSGDGDFTSLVNRVKAMGPRVEVIGFPRNTAKALVEAADAFQPLDRKFMIYRRAGKKPTAGKSATADMPDPEPAEVS